MSADYPRRTIELAYMVRCAHDFQASSLVLMRVLAEDTESSVEFWEALHKSGAGPKRFYLWGEIWYDAVEVDAWLLAEAGKRGQHEG